MGLIPPASGPPAPSTPAAWLEFVIELIARRSCTGEAGTALVEEAMYRFVARAMLRSLVHCRPT